VIFFLAGLVAELALQLALVETLFLAAVAVVV
jgi:hypothetical protein